jgi:hypothetical protein
MFLLLIVFQMIRKKNMSPLGCLKLHIQVLHLWLLKLKRVIRQVFFDQKNCCLYKRCMVHLQTCANVLTSIVSCNTLTLLEPFDGSFVWHALSKVCQYVITNEKMSNDLPCVPLKAIQFAI